VQEVLQVVGILTGGIDADVPGDRRMALGDLLQARA